MKDCLNITKALADENRLRMLLALQDGELCVCQITELMGLAMSTVSKHLSILYQAGLVNARKEGRWMYYSLPGKGAPDGGARSGGLGAAVAGGSERIAEDAAAVEEGAGDGSDASYASGNAETEGAVPLHRELVPEPDGRGLGAGAQGRLVEAYSAGIGEARDEPARGQGDGRGRRGHFAAVFEDAGGDWAGGV